ncbi:EboA domain-containing protein [Streptomyces griseoviridis]
MTHPRTTRSTEPTPPTRTTRPSPETPATATATTQAAPSPPSAPSAPETSTPAVPATPGATAPALPATPETPAPTTRATPGAPAPAPLPTPSTLYADLTPHLTPPARAWLDQALREADSQPGLHGPLAVWELRLAEAGRRCGHEHADAVRVLILHAARAGTDALTRVYSQGTAAERRAVLHALPHLVAGPDARPLVEDALRTNDTRLVAAAVGPYAARHLPPHLWRHAVLKCLFTGVPVTGIADLERRAHGDAELARMLGDHAAERTAAGRRVPEDLYRVLALTDPTATPPAQAADHGPHGTDGKES